MARFRTSARAVDMLGRQQIAGVPTAIAELFKNAHDAYADRVEIDCFAKNKLFILRDDGIGMTRADFEERWLVLGTESKVSSAHGVKLPPRDKRKPARPIIGEKGIGRLAIALLGPQVLMLTRADYGPKQRDVVASFINWGLFECPGINLDQIEIPIEVFPGDKIPTAADVERLVAATRSQLLSFRPNIDKIMFEQMRRHLDEFSVDPRQLLKGLSRPTLAEKGRGTHFYIQPVSDLVHREVERDIEYRDNQKTDQIADLRRHLLGFTNTMIPDAPPPRIHTAFRYWKTNENPLPDLIEDREFFTPEEFLGADHRIRGEFDKNGVWNGTVEIYGEDAIEHTVEPPVGLAKPVTCGSFRIDVAYIHGRKRQSILPASEYKKMNAKLSRLGGLYVYRDGIRVSPYGDTREDFLDFEHRRSRGAGYYFFSHRRMFGAVCISRKGNPDLTDKAGREGLQKNKAYGVFYELLVNLFLNVAQSYFRSDKDEPSLWERLRAELEVAEKARKEREKRTRKARRELKRGLKRFFELVEGDDIQDSVSSVLTSLHDKLQKLDTSDPNTALSFLSNVESIAERDLRSIRVELQIEKPSDLGLTRDERTEWAAYEASIAGLDQEVFENAEGQIASLVRNRAAELELSLNAKKRAKALAVEAISEARDRFRSAAEAVSAQLERVENAVEESLSEVTSSLECAEEKLIAELELKAESELDAEQLDTLRHQLTRQLTQENNRHLSTLTRIREQLEAARWTREKDGSLRTSLDETAAMEAELLGLRFRVEEDLELAQLGMAVEVIGHEFNSAVAGIRRNLKRLRKWGRSNETFKQLVDTIVGNFSHLDGYLGYLTPLYRRVHRQALGIEGQQMHSYLEELFARRLKDLGVELTATSEFLSSVTIAYPSTIYPVFINLVDNAIYWLSDRKPPRKIILDIDGKSLLVKDNGPGVGLKDREAIFERGFTRKPGGMGLGLFISREALASEKGNLTIDPLTAGEGTCFRIEPPPAKEET